jgi:hypothetical protein
LPDLDQVPVGIADVAAELASSIDGLREELRPAGAPFVVGRPDVRDPYVEHCLSSQDVGVEVPRALDVRRHNEVSEDDALRWRGN